MTQPDNVCRTLSKLTPTFTTGSPQRAKRSGYCFRVDLPHRLTGILIEFHLYYI